MHSISTEDLLTMASLLDTDPDRLVPVTLSGEDAIKAAAMLRAIASGVDLRSPTPDEAIPSAHDDMVARFNSPVIRMLREFRTEHMKNLESQSKRWVIRFEDERDFCNVASPLIGASFNSGDCALKRLNNGRLHTFGSVEAART